MCETCSENIAREARDIEFLESIRRENERNERIKASQHVEFTNAMRTARINKEREILQRESRSTELDRANSDEIVHIGPKRHVDDDEEESVDFSTRRGRDEHLDRVYKPITSSLRNGPLKNSREGLDNYRPVNERVVPRANIVQRQTNTYLNDDILRRTMMAGIIDQEDDRNANLWDVNQIYICPISKLNVYQAQFSSEGRMRFENCAEANALQVQTTITLLLLVAVHTVLLTCNSNVVL